jgi:glycosyltransferase involved in cell wall biosynthesis
MAKFSIILPVRNGGDYVKECVASILGQTFSDFDLQVLDNCSNDGTSEWLRSLNDKRVHLYRSESSLTIEQNWARITELRKNEFITLIGHDDVLDRHYLATMDALINKHPHASLYQTHFRYIDSKGQTIRTCKPMDEVQSAPEFLAFFLANTIDTMGTGFMMRASDYDRLGGIPPRYANLLFADFELFINLTNISYKATAFDEAFAFRLHQSTTTTSTDVKFQKAYHQFIDYLELLKKQDSLLDKVIQKYALNFIRTYSKGLAHRLLRTPTSKREGQTVAKLLQETCEHARRLVPGTPFNPEADYSVRLAKNIDKNPMLKRAFLLFKRIYSKPVYK